MSKSKHHKEKLECSSSQPLSKSIITEDSATCENKTDTWGSQFEFLLSTIGYSVGLGNIWRFPYLCVQNGGGAFLIPYFTLLMVCAMPLLMIEFTMAQYSGLGVTGIWNVCPVFKGLGWCMIAVSVVCTIYYNTIMTWILYYLAMSFQWDLDWKYCDNDWNTEFCFSDSYRNRSSPLVSNASKTMDYNFFNEANSTTVSTRFKSSLEEFWLYKALLVSSGIDNLGDLNLNLAGCSFVSWIIITLCLIKGVKSIGKVVYVTATTPYIFLTIIIIRGALLPGSLEGVKYYITPKWNTLLDFKVWGTAALQIFFSLGPAWGGMITMASFNRFKNNLVRDTVLVSMVCCMTSFYGGFAIFTMIGYIAHVSNSSSIGDVIQSGPGLAFIAYPQALSNLPGSMIWCILFFIMLYVVGLDSQFGTYETILSTIAENWPFIFSTKKRKFGIIISCSILCWMLGLLFCTQGGVYLFQIVDWYGTAFSVMVIALFECIVFGYFYGVKRMLSHIKEMVGIRSKLLTIWTKACWYCITPVIILVIFVRSCVTFEEPTFEKTYSYPRWAIVFGWSFVPITLLPFPAVLIYYVIKLRDKPRNLIKPTKEWNTKIHIRQQNALTFTNDRNNLNEEGEEEKQIIKNHSNIQ